MSPKSDGRIAHCSEHGLGHRRERVSSMSSLPPGELVSGDERASSSSSSSSPSSHGAAPAHDVAPGQYATVIREMIRHENEVTNHRIMWLLVVQGLIANAYGGSAV